MIPYERQDISQSDVDSRGAAVVLRRQLITVKVW